MIQEQMKQPFSLIDVTDEQILLKVNADNNLIIATHPYINSEYDYINVTRGRNHILTIIKTDGSTIAFNWGHDGASDISAALERLREEVIKFIEDENHILLELCDTQIRNAKIFYNPNYHKWQLTINNAYYSTSAASCVKDMFAIAKLFGVNAICWKHLEENTCCERWEAVL